MGDDISDDPDKEWAGEAEDDEMFDKKLAEEYVMEIDGFKCPERYVNSITPMEFEEMVNLFLEYDVDGSNTIDIHEARKILADMDMEHTMERAKELLDVHLLGTFSFMSITEI